MKSTIVAMCAAMTLSAASFAVQADVFRCTQPDGKIAYQATPCAAGSQKALDDRESRAREKAADSKKADAEQNKAAAERSRQQWLRCEEKKNCDDLCFGAGDAMATVFMANFSTMADNGVMASKMMNEGCEEQVGAKGAACVSMCKSGFKVKARSFLK